jgi:outer membrane protein assembly factor BamA
MAFILLAYIVLSGCAATRFLEEDESFYTGAEIELHPQGKIRNKKQLKKELALIEPVKPTPSILGSRPSAWLYFIAGEPKKEKGLKSFIKYKLGKEPALISDVAAGNTSSLMENYLNNEGYFGSLVQYEVQTKNKKSKVHYSVTLQPPFLIREISFDLFDTTKITTDEYKNSRILKPGQRYSLEVLQAEQKRIEALAKNSGFYYFDHRYLLFEGDSTVGDRQIDLRLTFEQGTPEEALGQYSFKSINVFPNYSFDNDSLTTQGDTLVVDGYRYIDNVDNFQPKIITDVINLEPDSLYRRDDHINTLSRLMSLQTFKFVSIKFRETGDSSTLHADINLTPQQKKSIRMQVQGVTKSNNFVGPGFEVTYTNRNFFRGAELFQFKLSGAYEWQISRQQAGSINALEVGAEASLTFPRFVIPIKIRNESSKYVPQTIIKAGFDFQQRLKYYRLTSFTTGIGYQWRETTYKSHELFPVELSYVRTSRTSAEFDSLLMDNPSLANSFQNQFIPGVRYVYTLNTQLRDGTEKNYQPNKIKRSNFFFQGTIGLAGNIINGLQSTKSEEEPGTLFNLPYSQYVRGETDFRYYLQLDQHNKIATRLNIGVGYAYGNSTNLPYIKQFAVGGSNSLRAFPARSVGPGTYNVRADSTFTSDTYFIDQRGDIKLEANIEYRFDIFKGLKGAVFVDAGNIWLIRNDEARPGGQFEWDTFLGELAVGTGVGIRYDFNFFVLRLDTAFPLRKAYLPVGQRWVVDQIDFGSSSWRKENLVFNIAIGYPF